MTFADLKELLPEWQARLGLSHWEIVIELEHKAPENEGAYFEIQRHEHVHRAIIYVQAFVVGEAETPNWVLDELTDEFIERGLVHELNHCLFTDIRLLTNEVLERSLGEAAYEAMKIALNRAEEQTVDLLARALTKGKHEDVELWAAEHAKAQKAKGEYPLHDNGQPYNPATGYLVQEIDDSVHSVPVYESGHLLGQIPDEWVKRRLEEYSGSEWCWCEPSIMTHDEEGNEFRIPFVQHRDKLDREGPATD